MKRVFYLSAVLLLCLFAAFGAARFITFLTDSTELGGFAGLAAFVGNLFMIEPIKSPIIK